VAGSECDSERIEPLVQRLTRQGLERPDEAYLCAALAAALGAARTRALPGQGPALYLSTIELRLRLDRQVCSVTIVAAVCLDAHGARTLVDLEVGRSAAQTFWQGFLQVLAARGLADWPLTVLGDHAQVSDMVLRELVQSHAPNVSTLLTHQAAERR
jgi:transposase-like protein